MQWLYLRVWLQVSSLRLLRLLLRKYSWIQYSNALKSKVGLFYLSHPKHQGDREKGMQQKKTKCPTFLFQKPFVWPNKPRQKISQLFSLSLSPLFSKTPKRIKTKSMAHARTLAYIVWEHFRSAKVRCAFTGRRVYYTHVCVLYIYILHFTETLFARLFIETGL